MTSTAPTSPPTSTAPPRGTRRGIAPRVFWPSVAIVGVLGLLAVAFPARAEGVIGALQSDVIGAFGWYYVLIVAGFVAFSLWMGFGRFADITLGPDDEEPQYSRRSWFAMLFSAGMGIGLVFWGVAEPLNHFAQPKPGVVGAPERIAEMAMAQTYLHWGVHAWAIYVVVGLALAYAIHRKGRPVSVRWALEPLLGTRRAGGRIGDAVDVAAVVGTVFGVATSLGLGVLQISSGLEHLGLLQSSVGVQVVLILVITAAATLSVLSGLDRGVKWLSNINVTLAGALLVVLLVLGPTLFLLREFVQSIGVYLANVIPMTFNVSAFAGVDGQAWQAAWTTFYWGWWISWAPFVGVFIARISRGRTVREFVLGVLGVPVLVTFLWFSVLGGSALYRELFGAGGLITDGSVNTVNSLFDLLEGLPAGAVLSAGVIVLIALFFITSADSGSLVIAMLTGGGDLDPPVWSRVTWAVSSGLLAAALLVAGGLVALQTMAILIALPFSVVMIGMCVATWRAFRDEHRAFVRAERSLVRDRLTAHVTSQVNQQLPEQVGQLVSQGVGAAPAAGSAGSPSSSGSPSGVTASAPRAPEIPAPAPRTADGHGAGQRHRP